jgi:hypothetical protein
MAFFVDFAVFFKTIDGVLQYGALKNSDKFGPSTVLNHIKVEIKTILKSSTNLKLNTVLY